MTRRMWLMAGPLVGISAASTTCLAAQAPVTAVPIPAVFSQADATPVKPELRHHRLTTCTEFQDVCTRVRML